MARMGRPPIYNNCIDLDGAIELYFESRQLPLPDNCAKDSDGHITHPDGSITYYKQLPLTMSGLAIACGMDRETLLRYGKKDGYSDHFRGPIKRAKDRVQSYVEEYLFNGKNTVGAIFNLKNNFSWVDRQEVGMDDQTHESLMDKVERRRKASHLRVVGDDK